MDRTQHWEGVYATGSPSEVSWYQAEATVSLDLMTRVAGPEAAILDVGGGAATLVDGLLGKGYHDVTVLDLAGMALQAARARLGGRAATVRWLVGDVLIHPFPAGSVDIWHDRAVFHFLTDAEDRRRYVAQVVQALRPGGIMVMATFSLEGPTRCSGLDVVRYSPETLQAEFQPGFRLIECREEEHRTPRGQPQQFLYCVFRREVPEGDVREREVRRL